MEPLTKIRCFEGFLACKTLACINNPRDMSTNRPTIIQWLMTQFLIRDPRPIHHSLRLGFDLHQCGATGVRNEALPLFVDHADFEITVPGCY
jgi:hypothetical protein